MSQAFVLTGLGMSIVFIVLALTYGSIVVLGFMERRFAIPESVATAPVFSPVAPADTGLTPEEEAAIHAAISHHTGMAPETFQTRITPVKKES